VRRRGGASRQHHDGQQEHTDDQKSLHEPLQTACLHRPPARPDDGKNIECRSCLSSTSSAIVPARHMNSGRRHRGGRISDFNRLNQRDTVSQGIPHYPYGFRLSASHPRQISHSGPIPDSISHKAGRAKPDTMSCDATLRRRAGASTQDYPLLITVICLVEKTITSAAAVGSRPPSVISSHSLNGGRICNPPKSRPGDGRVENPPSVQIIPVHY
jgi:hypothetical protein